MHDRDHALAREIEAQAQLREARRLWAVVMSIASEVESRHVGDDAALAAHRERVRKLHSAFWQVFR